MSLPLANPTGPMEAVARFFGGPDGFCWRTPMIEAAVQPLSQAGILSREGLQGILDLLRSATYSGFGVLQVGVWGRNP